MTALIARQNIDGSKPDTPSGVNVANLQLGLGNAWDCLQTLGVGVFSAIAGTSALTQANAGLVLIDASGGNVILNLPAASVAVGALFQFKRLDASTNSVTVNRAGTDTIDGATFLSIVAQQEFEQIRSDGTGAWKRLSTLANPVRVRNLISANDSLFRNRVINGNCFEDQRNSGVAQTFTAAAALAYCIDRFYAYCTGANVNGQQVAAADNTKRYRFSGAASVTGIGFGHRIEAANSLDLAGNTCTFSVKLANTLLGTVAWAMYYANTDDTFGTLAAPTRTFIASGNFTGVTGAEALYTAAAVLPAAAKTGVEIVLTVGAQTSGTWSIGEIQLEKGAIPAAAVSFERVDTALNRRRCQWYRRIATVSIRAWAPANGALFGYSVQFEPMRVIPTLAFGGVTSNFNVTSESVSGLAAPTVNSFSYQVTITAIGDAAVVNRIVTLDAEL